METIGIPALATFIIGVPAMILFILSIWNALTLSHKIMACTSGLIFIIAVIWFVYSQTKKKFYILPNLLYKKYSITKKYATNINSNNELNEEDFYNAYKIIDIDFKSIFSGNNLIDFRNQMDSFYTQVKSKEIPDDDSSKFFAYLMKKTGLQKRLTEDVEYIKLESEITKMRLLIPNQDMNLAVAEFIKVSDSANSILPLIQISNRIPDETLSKMFPVKMEATLIGLDKKINDNVITAFVKVRESIDKYYRKTKTEDLK